MTREFPNVSVMVGASLCLVFTSTTLHRVPCVRRAESFGSGIGQLFRQVGSIADRAFEVLDERFILATLPPYSWPPPSVKYVGKSQRNPAEMEPSEAIINPAIGGVKASTGRVSRPSLSPGRGTTLALRARSARGVPLSAISRLRASCALAYRRLRSAE